MEEEKKRSKLSPKFYLALVAVVILLACIGFSFAGSYYTVKVNGEKVGFGLASILAGDPLGAGVGIAALCFAIILPVISSVLILLSGRFKKLLFVAMIFLLAGAIGSMIMTLLVAKMDGVKQIEFCGNLPTLSLILAAFLSFFGITTNEEFTINDIVEMGMLIAMAVALSIIRLFRMPTGGSVNFQMLPLFILALRRGPVKAFVGAGVVYGLITCLTDGYGFATYPFDYLIGFGSVAVVGFFSPYILGKGQNKFNIKGEIFIVIACVLSTAVRFLAGTASSMIIYDYDFVAAATYNVGYVFISGAMSMAVLMILYGPLAALNARFPVRQAE